MPTNNTFLQRQQEFRRAEGIAQRQYNQLAFWRLSWFIGTITVVWLLIQINQQIGAIVVFLTGVTGFLLMLKKHQAIRQIRDINHYLAFINQDEEGRLTRQYLRPETGDQFSNPVHPYSGDLDLFGKHSLFRLVNRTHTHEGQNRLASWLQNPADSITIRHRQQAISELVPQLDWRQQLEALAYLNDTIPRSPDSLIGWATAPGIPLPAYLAVVRFALPILTLGVFIAWLLGYVPGLAVFVLLAIHGFVLNQTSERAKEVSEQTFEISTALRGFRQLVQHAEQLTGQTSQLIEIRQALSSGGRPASEVIGQLARLTEGLNYRRNPYFSLLIGIATLWDIHYLFRLEQWRHDNGPNLKHWFDALGELEALNSLAGFAYAHPTYTSPTVVEGQFVLDFTSAAHPLLPPDRSVANSLSISGNGKTILITGSNMSGKSTFLRTVGTNVILALAGAVVSAERFVCSPVRVFTSMRTQDSLEESTSSFYAELKRLQTLIGLSKPVNEAGKQGENAPMLYFLDEILKGTNSADRHRGAEALIRQLHRTTASGFVSTHDLELGQLTDTADFVQNYHFQSDLHQGTLQFDYKLRRGICESFNASQLMRAIGIEVDVAPLKN